MAYCYEYVCIIAVLRVARNPQAVSVEESFIARCSHLETFTGCGTSVQQNKPKFPKLIQAFFHRRPFKKLELVKNCPRKLNIMS